MRVLKTEEFFYVGGGDASDSTTGSMGSVSNRGESPGASSSAAYGCSSGVSVARYNTIAAGWASFAALAAATGSAPVGISAGLMSLYNTYCALYSDAP